MTLSLLDETEKLLKAKSNVQFTLKTADGKMIPSEGRRWSTGTGQSLRT